MIDHFQILPLAQDDIDRTAEWYAENSPDFTKPFVDEVYLAIQRAVANPSIFQIIRKRDSLRRVLMERFPYKVYFKTEGNVLLVFAVLHSARHSRAWQRR